MTLTIEERATSDGRPQSAAPTVDPQSAKEHVELGLEKLLEEGYRALKDQRVGLICNQASVDHGYRHAADLLHEHDGIQLKALFGPQHGIRGDVQDNMIETGHSLDRKTGLPVHSLYSETREPTDEMLQDVDVLVFDMQDVGCRIYTFVYTLANCMRAARRLGKKVKRSRTGKSSSNSWEFQLTR